MKPLISVALVGAPKSGTTSLKFYLASHPDLCTHQAREFIFFADDELYPAGYTAAYDRYLVSCSNGQLPVIKSVAMLYSPRAMRRLRMHNPNVAVVLSLRDPVQRAYSEYWYARRRGWETEVSFDAAVSASMQHSMADAVRRTSYVRRGEYVRFVSWILDLFPREQVFADSLESLRAEPASVCHPVYDFLGLPDFEPTEPPPRSRNRGARARSEPLQRIVASSHHLRAPKAVFRLIAPHALRARIKEGIQRVNSREFSPPPIHLETRLRLMSHFGPLNEELQSLLGIDVSAWCQGAKNES